MNLLIKIENGKPVNHPIAEENLRVFYPNLDVNNPPLGYAKFIRKLPPNLSPYQKLDSTEYVLDSALSAQYNTSTWTDKYVVKELTQDEISELLAAEVRSSNEKMRQEMNAPYAAPDDGNLYVWAPSSNRWVIMPDNFNDIITRFTKKLNELGLTDMTPEQLQTIEPSKLNELQQIVNEINTIEGFENFGL